ncbi:MAG: TolC family protein [Tannerellaceae bacterium]
MKKYITIAALTVCFAFPASGQTRVDEVLRSIETNNKELRANIQFTLARKIETRLDNNLPDPSVSYSHQYGNKEELGMQGELVASQSFSFPTVYREKGKLARTRSVGFDHEAAAFRQQILLQAKELCLDLVFLNQQQQLLELRLNNATELASLYAVRLATGDANVLEVNKIDLELLNARSEARMNRSARDARLQELAALNGGLPIAFADTVYAPLEVALSFADLCREALPANLKLRSLESDRVAARRLVGVMKAQHLPGFELGYRLNTAMGGERFNGFLVGVSIPLFANRNKVKQAKAQTIYTDLQLESTSLVVKSELQGLYDRALALKTSIDEYDRLLKSRQNLLLLSKAIRSGQISMIEYFVEVSTLYDSMRNYILLQNEYQKAMARLYKHRLG